MSIWTGDRPYNLPAVFQTYTRISDAENLEVDFELGDVNNGHFMLVGHSVTNNNPHVVTKTPITNAYTYIQGEKWRLKAEVNGVSAGSSETWTLRVLRFHPSSVRIM